MSDFSELMERIGYRFQNPALLDRALTHSSFANERGVESNERLEFLGDSVLGFIAADYLYKNESGSEGKLSKHRASVVCEKALAHYSRSIGVGDCLRLGKGERLNGGADRESTLEDAFEAIVGAIYLDGGLEPARAFALPFLETELHNTKNHQFRDYKTLLQEVVQHSPEEILQYVLVGESGPDHDKKFTVEVHLNSNVIGRGTGKTKREAEQQGAREALKLMGF